MPHCARSANLKPKFEQSRPRAATARYLRRKGTVEGKGVAMGTRQGRRKTLNPVKTALNIHERPVRKKKKTPKYETYERDRGVITQTKEPPPEVETNVLLALGLTPVKNGLNRMHVSDEDEIKGSEKANLAVPESVPADSLKKGVAVAVAASTTVDDTSSGGEAEAKPAPPSPKVNGICDSAGDESKSKIRRIGKEDKKLECKEVTSNTVSDPVPVKIKEEEEEPTVESSEPQDLTVTCTANFEASPKTFPAAKYISISVEQCQTPPPMVNNHMDEQKRPRSVSSRKRSNKSSDGEENGYKRSRCDDRESAVSDFVEKASSSGLDELTRHAEVLQQEIHGLSALARSKELEWNDVIRMKKLKEEMYLRLIRRKQIMLLTIGAGSRLPDSASWDFALENRMSEFFTSDEVSLNRVKPPRIPSNLTITKSQSGASQQLQRFLLHPQRQEMQQQFQQGHRSVLKTSKTARSAPFPILPKLNQGQQEMNLPPGVGRQTGSQGPIVDVKSIIADYRQSHPESIPRRGRRMKGAVADNMVSSSRGVLSMSSLALGSGSQVRTVGSTSGPEESSRPSSADSSRSESVSFKDVLVQFAKMTNPPVKPPPPYPEVTLHPVLPGTSQSPPPRSSLLHGILTKTGAAAASSGGSNKPTTFSPTLARLLTTPDRPSTTTTITTATRGPSGTSSSNSTRPVSISELLSTSRKRNELTITPVSNAQQDKPKDEAVSGSHEEDPDDSDRLVIDEGFDGEQRHEDAETDLPDAVPECQGCHLKAAQFVCAGCGNQWYCSRNCQVAAWDEHSDVCSG